jgi:cold shock CspA family protein
MTGYIKRLVPDRHFGFITAQDGVEHFFHTTGLDPAFSFAGLEEGQEVEFEPVVTEKGPRATSVRPLATA